MYWSCLGYGNSSLHAVFCLKNVFCNGYNIALYSYCHIKFSVEELVKLSLKNYTIKSIKRFSRSGVIISFFLNNAVISGQSSPQDICNGFCNVFQGNIRNCDDCTKLKGKFINIYETYDY